MSLARKFKIIFFLLVLALPSLVFAGNERFRYINKNCTNAGLGFNPTCAASAGANGAAKTVAAVVAEVEATFPSGLVSPNADVFAYCVGCSGGELGVQTLAVATDGSHRLTVYSVTASAAPEICSNGVDDVLATGGTANGTKGSCPSGFVDPVIGLGCDKLCSTPRDADHDGYTTTGAVGAAGVAAIDCDDNDRNVFPNVWVPNSKTSPTGYKQCHATNGSFSSVVLNSTAPLCEATGTGVCKYINCSTGNDTTGDGSYSNPWLTPGKIGGGSGSPPAGAFTMTAGSVGYLLGSGTCATAFTNGGGGTSVAGFDVNGTSTNPITFKRYPGSTAVIESTAGNQIFLRDGRGYWVFEDLELAGGSGTLLFLQNAHDVRTSRVYFRDPVGLNGNNNNSCAYSVNASNIKYDHVYFKNCVAREGNPTNVSPVMWLDNDLSGDGDGHEAKFVTIWQEQDNDAVVGGAFRQKHGANAADVGVAGHVIAFAKVLNYNTILNFNGSGVRLKYNLGVNTDLGGVGTSAESNFHQDEIIEYNTISNGNGFSWAPTFLSSDEKTTLTHNNIDSPKSSWVNGNSEGIYSIAGYASDASYTIFTSHVAIESDYNCLKANTALQFCFFCQNAGAGGGAGNSGSFMTLAQWRTDRGQDANTANVALNYTSEFESQATECLANGYLRGYESSPSGGLLPPQPSTYLGPLFPGNKRRGGR